MDKKTLVESFIREGGTLLHNLDQVLFPVQSAFWYFDPESENWKLILVSPKVIELGPRETYRQVSECLEGLNEISLNDITLLKPDNQLVLLLKSVLKTENNAISNIRFTGNTINNFFIPDVYIYRLS